VFSSPEPLAAPILGDPGAGAGDPSPITDAPVPGVGAPKLSGGRPSVGVVVSCVLETDGATTCAVSHGQASVCPERIPGDDLERSFRRYDYLLTEGGCTLSADYWRTHGRDGEATFDDTWDRLDGSQDVPFFNAPETAEEILAEGAGDGTYYRLARAYIATDLNGINGAPFPEDVAGAFEEATVLFLAASPAGLDPDTARRFEEIAVVLEDYNDGAKEPGTCPILTAPFSAADVGKTLEGVESRDVGRIVAVDQRFDLGAGVVTIRPGSEDDQFVLPDEAFTVDGVRKAKFTTQLSDCVVLATGQECTIAVGGQCSEPGLTTAAFLDRERLLRMIVAVTEAAAEGESATIASEATTRTSLAPPGIGAGIGGPGSFPSLVLPPATAGGGGGEFVIVPNVIGRTVGEAKSIITAAQLSVGDITMQERRAMLAPVVGVAWAQNEDDATVLDQSPNPGTEAVPGDPVDMTAEFSMPIPEPASLVLFATGLAFVVLVMMWRRSD
jgi:hypothetical protein